jgi:hypothetical protein
MTALPAGLRRRRRCDRGEGAGAGLGCLRRPGCRRCAMPMARRGAGSRLVLVGPGAALGVRSPPGLRAGQPAPATPRPPHDRRGRVHRRSRDARSRTSSRRIRTARRGRHSPSLHYIGHASDSVARRAIKGQTEAVILLSEGRPVAGRRRGPDADGSAAEALPRGLAGNALCGRGPLPRVGGGDRARRDPPG